MSDSTPTLERIEFAIEATHAAACCLDSDGIREIARAALDASGNDERIEDAGHAAYTQGYRDGYVDAHVSADEGWPEDDGKEILRGVQSTAVADGWQNYADTFRAAIARTQEQSEIGATASPTGSRDSRSTGEAGASNLSTAKSATFFVIMVSLLMCIAAAVGAQFAYAECTSWVSRHD